ncbi:ATP-binding protein, partial [Bifidobacterium longum]|uniref:ATP-binding protein n=1 Tax=Bifidobacterium longum TaxID=216816 RepID=UPI003B998C31
KLVQAGRAGVRFSPHAEVDQNLPLTWKTSTRSHGPLSIEQTHAELVLQLGKAKRDGTLETMLRDIGRADLIILDEFGYVPFDIDGARLLYQIIAGSYERRSIIFTTNIEFSKWGTVFADDKLAAAIIDRIVHHGRLLEFTGQSRRVSEALMFGRNTSAQPEK